MTSNLKTLEIHDSIKKLSAPQQKFMEKTVQNFQKIRKILGSVFRVGPCEKQSTAKLSPPTCKILLVNLLLTLSDCDKNLHAD